MRHLLTGLLLLGLSGSAWADPLTRGQRAPTTTFVDANPTSPTADQTVGTRTFAGSASLWYFLGEDGALRRQLPALERFRRELRDDQIDLTMVVVVPQALAAEAADLSRGHALSLALDSDDVVFGAWGAQPGTLYLLDGEGVVYDSMDLVKYDLNRDVNTDDLELRVEILTYDKR